MSEKLAQLEKKGSGGNLFETAIQIASFSNFIQGETRTVQLSKKYSAYAITMAYDGKMDYVWIGPNKQTTIHSEANTNYRAFATATINDNSIDVYMDLLVGWNAMHVLIWGLE